MESAWTSELKTETIPRMIKTDKFSLNKLKQRSDSIKLINLKINLEWRCAGFNNRQIALDETTPFIIFLTFLYYDEMP